MRLWRTLLSDDRFSDDRGSLPFALLLTMLGVAMSALLTPMVTTQLSATRTDAQRVRSLHAAQAGLDVAIAHIRAARDSEGTGVLPLLPCGPLTGAVGGGSPARYRVTIEYLTEDPQGHVDDTAWFTGKRIACAPGGGVLDTPAFALLRADGTDQATGGFTPGRSLAATYIFQTTNENIAGGLIHVFKTATSLDLCLDAGSDSPAAGTPVRMEACSAGSGQQRFAYNPNLTLVLTASQTPAQPLGMCLDAGNPQTYGAIVMFEPCGATTMPQQQWSINDSANFEGSDDGRTLNGKCFIVQSPNTPGSFVSLGTCGGPYNNIHTFSPEAATGAGAAGASGGQLVNFRQFGRCVDVTEHNVNYNYLIVWPCKQAPDPANVSWNQKWVLPPIPADESSGSGTISTTRSGVRYCLRSPGRTAPGLYVRVVECSGDLAEEWTIYTDTKDYTTSYRVVDSNGYCLSASDPDRPGPDLYPNGQRVSKTIVEDCGPSTLQKWNAPPHIIAPMPLKDVMEK